jgi:Cyclin, N-terminal domain/WW domain
MWGLGSKMQGDDTYQFSRNVRLVAAKEGEGEQLEALFCKLIDEMSFWIAEPDVRDKVAAHGTGHSRRRPRSPAGALSSATLHGAGDGLRTEIKNHPEKPPTVSVWKTAVDPATGASYYYDSITRKSQWEKPAEIRALEKQQKEERRRIDAVFFKEMEANILKSLERGELIPGIPSSLSKNSTVKPFQSFFTVGPPREPSSPPVSDTTGPSPGRIRTISAMDEILLAELQRDAINDVAAEVRKQDDLSLRSIEYHWPRSGRPPLPTGSSRRNAEEEDNMSQCPMELSPDPVHSDKQDHPFHRGGITISQAIASPALTHEDTLAGESLLDDPIQDETTMILEIAVAAPDRQLSKAHHTRRNTGGTIYLQNTIFNPNVQATITCVCGVYRAHIVQAVQNNVGNSPAPGDKSSDSTLPDTFNINVFRDKRLRPAAIPLLPSLSEIHAFYQEFFQRSKMEQDTIIMSLIYVERLVKSTNGVLAPSPDNWRSILFACMVLASKVWDDLSMWNVDFSNVSAVTAGLSAFTLSRINQLELALLKALNFDVRVPAGEYAKYYFLIRTMLLRSGLMEENSQPLQRKREEDASFSKLENLTTQYQKNTLPTPAANVDGKNSNTPSYSNNSISRPETLRYRVQSLDGVMPFLNAGSKPGPVLRDKVCLEQLVG